MKFGRNFEPFSASQCPQMFRDKRARGTLEGGISRSGNWRVWLGDHTTYNKQAFGLSRVAWRQLCR